MVGWGSSPGGKRAPSQVKRARVRSSMVGCASAVVKGGRSPVVVRSPGGAGLTVVGGVAPSSARVGAAGLVELTADGTAPTGAGGGAADPLGINVAGVSSPRAVPRASGSVMTEAVVSARAEVGVGTADPQGLNAVGVASSRARVVVRAPAGASVGAAGPPGTGGGDASRRSALFCCIAAGFSVARLS